MCRRCGCLAEAEDTPVRPAVVEGVLEAELLLVLAKGDSYGYALAGELAGQSVAPSPIPPARVYEALRRLELDGAVESRDEASPDGPDRRRYRITVVGQDRLDRWADALRQTERGLHRLLHAYDEYRAAPRIRRAL